MISFNGGIEVKSGKSGGKLRIKRSSGSTDGDDIFDIHLSDNSIYFELDNDLDGDSSNYIFGYKKNAAFSTLLYMSDSIFQYNGNNILHSGSTIDADTLDGQQPSYYLDADNFENMPSLNTWSSGTSVPANSSGNNGDYFFETDTDKIHTKANGTWSEITDVTGADGNGISSTVDNNDGTFTLNYTDGTSFTTTSTNYQKVSTVQTLNSGWYTIAKTGTNKLASGKFSVRCTQTNRGHTVHFYASHTTGAGNRLTVLNNATNGNLYGFTDLRIKYGSSTSGAMVQIYLSASRTGCFFEITEDVQDSGWTLCDWLSTEPISGLSNTYPEIDLTDGGGIISSHDIVEKGTQLENKYAMGGGFTLSQDGSGNLVISKGNSTYTISPD